MFNPLHQCFPTFSLCGTLLTNKNVCGTHFGKVKSLRNPFAKFLTIIIMPYPEKVILYFKNNIKLDWFNGTAC
jgi:hypothetical protein